MRADYFLSRKDHDRLLEVDGNLLTILFGSYTRRWGAGGVTFFDVDAEIREQLDKILQ